jgi:hypothetical protein
MNPPRRSRALPAAAIALVCCGLAALPASCFVRRATDDYACGSDDDCRSGRVCDQGFCVAASTAACPAACASCDPTDMSCRIECNGNKPCGNVQCPIGWQCSIRCNNAAACGEVDCTIAKRCTIDCNGAASCGPLRCGAGACDVRCSGTGACPAVDCAASCSCDVACNAPASECPQMSCPQAIGPCTRDGSDGAPCDSSEPGCGLCIAF